MRPSFGPRVWLITVTDRPCNKTPNTNSFHPIHFSLSLLIAKSAMPATWRQRIALQGGTSKRYILTNARLITMVKRQVMCALRFGEGAKAGDHHHRWVGRLISVSSAEDLQQVRDSDTQQGDLQEPHHIHVTPSAAGIRTTTTTMMMVMVEDPRKPIKPIHIQ